MIRRLLPAALIVCVLWVQSSFAVRAQDLYQEAADALFNLGLIDLTRAKEENSGHDEAWKRERAEHARQLFDQAEQVSPLDPDVPLALGETLRILGQVAGARAQYERALKLGLPPSSESAVQATLSELN